MFGLFVYLLISSEGKQIQGPNMKLGKLRSIFLVGSLPDPHFGAGWGNEQVLAIA